MKRIYLVHGPEYDRILGTALGFPQCCVEWFAAGNRAYMIPNDVQEATKYQRGPRFVTCPEHQAMLIRGVTFAEILGRSHQIDEDKLALELGLFRYAS